MSLSYFKDKFYKCQQFSFFLNPEKHLVREDESVWNSLHTCSIRLHVQFNGIFQCQSISLISRPIPSANCERAICLSKRNKVKLNSNNIKFLLLRQVSRRLKKAVKLFVTFPQTDILGWVLKIILSSTSFGRKQFGRKTFGRHAQNSIDTFDQLTYD